MKVEQTILDHINKSFKELYSSEIDPALLKLQPTKKEFDGDLTFVTFPSVRFSKASPEKTAEDIGNYLKEKTDLLADFNVVKGFLNLKISDKAWMEVFSLITSDDDYGFSKYHGKEVMVEYSSPNTNKPLHLGHLRNIFLGFSISRIFEANGYKVHKVQIINDRGIHICKSMLAWKRFGNGETPDSSGEKGDKLVGKYYVEFEKRYREQVNQLMSGGMTKEEAEKEAPIIKEAQEMLKKWEEKEDEVYGLWKTMNQWVYDGFEQTYQTMGVDFDKLYYESETFVHGKNEVQKGLDRGIFYKKDDGSVWVDLEDEGLDHKLLLRADGTSVYITQDIGTAILRFTDYPDLKKLIYTVGNEQEYHFKVLFLILKKLGFKWAEELYHLSYGMVDLPTGKMKSREGTVVDADDLMVEMVKTAKEQTKQLGKIEDFSEEEARELYKTIGLGALKFFLLRVDPRKRILFDPEESVELHGFTGPFIQYTYARICAITRRALQENFDFELKIEPGKAELNEYERSVIFNLNSFKDKILEAEKELSPSIIAQYAYELAKEYNKFYSEVSIFNEKDTEKIQFRIVLSDQVGRTIKKSMWLLGAEVPERM